MTSKTINPEGLYNSLQFGFSHAKASDEAVTVHCAGQVAWDKECNVVGVDDIGAQARQALANLRHVLEEAGAGIEDLVRIRTYVVNHNPEYMQPIGAALAEFYGDVTPAPNTWIGVQALAMPDFMIEIEATAQIPSSSGS
ncbi:endoribonuclease L-PSP [Luminiphilus syltensis NOR5-1B]|uniref:Endoribonuclease L-PSP n=1 Tax=Luminiphilus syltensis NOR5-1B TaxID=565045 RepID=B8KS41_9GAMM|nr:RidA family protein [Luminiphilus syltensis]EED35424.1 endoribonuclease L-PSP [Luminiphilus syltensis NOR5-1B]